MSEMVNVSKFKMIEIAGHLKFLEQLIIHTRHRFNVGYMPDVIDLIQAETEIDSALTLLKSISPKFYATVIEKDSENV